MFPSLNKTLTITCELILKLFCIKYLFCLILKNHKENDLCYNKMYS